MLILGVLVSLFPFYWMVVMAANATADILERLGGELLVGVVNVASVGSVVCYSTLINASTSTGCVRAFQARCTTD